MDNTKRLNQYKEVMYSMINLINKVVPLEEKNQVLIVLRLDTIEKIQKWMDWLRPRWKSENDLEATEAEIVRAAVHINKGLI